MRHPMIVALVNNMPDSAFIDTEDQFRTAMTAGAAEDVEVVLYTITGIPRSEEVASAIQSRYRELDQLWSNVPDALIVTGTEPAQVQLAYEPYWPYLARLLEWAATSVPTTLLSCLTSQASVLLFDGIQRVQRASKCSGVYDCSIGDPSDPLVSGLPELVPVPHSRVYDVPEEPMVQAGYRIVIGSGPSRAGWAVAVRKRGDGMFVLCQGHPEYGTLSLLREYRRDVRRFLFGRGAVPYPALPEGYLDPEAAAILNKFERRVSIFGGDPRELWARFPYAEVADGVKNTWASSSATLYSNWLGLARAAVRAGA
jgi:homoserine O-succinyltransferase/O-acetyltransferase